MAESNSDQPNQHPTIVELGKKLFDLLQQYGIRGGIGYYHLLTDRIKVGIPQLDRDTAGQSFLSPQLKSQPFGHPDQFTVQELHVDGLLPKGFVDRKSV